MIEKIKVSRSVQGDRIARAEQIRNIRRDRQGEGYQVVDGLGRLKAQGFDTEQDAEDWIKLEQFR